MSELVPHWAELVVERVERAAGEVLVWARTRDQAVACPACDRLAHRVHSRYDRRLADAALTGQPVALRLRVRRMFCDSADCEVRTFAEQPPGVAAPWARRTPLARTMLESVSRAMAGRAGARLTGALGMPVSRNTLVRLLHALPDPPTGPVTVLGVDDWAIRRGQSYATILIDMATHRPVDVLADREADTLADWLSQHPEVEVITRDRSSAYAEAASRGDPQAVQCADRWHLLKNLGEAVEKTVIAHRTCLPEPAGSEGAAPGLAAPGSVVETRPAAAPEFEPGAAGEEPESSWEKRIRERFTAVQTLRTQGKGIREIARELGLVSFVK